VATAARPLAAARNQRVLLVVALAALAAAAAVVGVTLLQTRGQTTTVRGALTTPRPGTPLLDLNFGVGASTQTRALVRAQSLYNHNHIARAAAIFGRYHSLEAQIGSAFAAWDQDGLTTMKSLAAAHPASGVVLLHLGLADYQAGRNADAVAAWERTARVAADSPYGVRAEDLLHPTLRGRREIPGLPYLLVDYKPPRAVLSLPAAKELAALARAATKPDARAKVVYGLALWSLQRPLSAERQFDAAANLAPNEPVAQTAAAVGAFTKADPTKAFGRLGPLTARFPKSSVVRLHLGLLLLWTGEQKKAVAQLRIAAADEPGSPYSKDAQALLARLPGTRSK
jgi:tetratricopeptide (TPR) repeat protein